jgi:hypothetical protein
VGQSWCKVSATLDGHPRIRRAGNLGRQVFEFALRRNAEVDRNGVIPEEHFEPDYLADVLMLTQDDALSGLSRCVRTGLLARDSGNYVICGWDDEWGKRPMTEAERKRNQRIKQRDSSNVTKCHDGVVTVSGHERDCPDSHAGEERRGEEKREESSPAPAIQPSTESGATPAAPPVAVPPGQSRWHRQKAWWEFMLEADGRIRTAKLKPFHEPLPRNFAGDHERNLLACEKQLSESGYSAEEVDAKMRHIVLVNEAEAFREQHRKWFKPSMIWEPRRALRAADTPLEEASAARAPPASSFPDRRPPERPNPNGKPL